VTVCAFGGAFAGPSIDIGTRFLVEQLVDLDRVGAGDMIDFACGTGVIATWLALRHPERSVIASDQSASAAASAAATAQANGVADRVEVVRDLGLSSRADASASFIALNPPFHAGSAVPLSGVAAPLFAEAGRVLSPGGELWAVWNSPLHYRPTLERLVGRTRQVARNSKFTVTVSTRS
jgi:16S rRNA (guanine1207-N2)-methyltransferase